MNTPPRADTKSCMAEAPERTNLVIRTGGAARGYRKPDGWDRGATRDCDMGLILVSHRTVSV
jgi:hypothetical protein